MKGRYLVANLFANLRRKQKSYRPLSSQSSSTLNLLDKQLFEKKQTPRGVTRLVTSYADVPVSNVRSLSVIAHIDHGKSTLSDKLLEHCENIWPTEKGKRQVLDTLEVERQRGITVKAQSCSLLYKDAKSNEDFLINLVDTPGHVDFSFEVGRSLAACQGALLLVDCSQGVQAQTVANHNAAKEAGLKIIPVLTKIDLPTADPEPALAALEAAFGFSPDEAIWTSAKSGAGISDLFPAILSRLPPPVASRKSPLRCLLFDSWFDEHRGVICCVQVVDGTLKVGDVIVAAHSGDKFTVQEVGLMAPQKVPVSHLAAGHIGYVICGMKNVKQAILGDTFFSQSDYSSLGRQLLPVLKGFKPAKPMVFASLYPVDSGDFSALLTATERLTLNDASVSVEKESSSSLGFGLRCGFLGLLHMDVFNQRLQDEFKTDVIITAPMVAYKVLLKNGKEITVERPADFPPSQDVEAYFEPTAHVSIMAPGEFLSPLLGLLTDRRGVQEDIIFLNNADNGQNQMEAAKALLAALPSSKTEDANKVNKLEIESSTEDSADTSRFAASNDDLETYGNKENEEEDEEESEEEEEVDAPVHQRPTSAPSSRHHQLALSQDRVVLKFIMPWAEVVSHLADIVKSMTAGYASLDWMPGAYKKSDIVKVDMLMNSKPVDALSFIAHRDKALSEARRVALKLKGSISRQMFEINIQAAIGSKIVAKERIPPFRKDVLIKSGKTVGGGDKSRKEKLLSKQREGKRRMKTVGNVELPQAAFLSIMSSEK